MDEAIAELYVPFKFAKVEPTEVAGFVDIVPRETFGSFDVVKEETAPYSIVFLSDATAQ